MSNKTLTLLMGFVAFLILVVGVVFVVVAVGGGGDDDGTPASNNDSTPGSKSTPRPNTGGASQICQGNTLVLDGNEPQTVLDPIQAADVSTSEYIVELFGGLVTLDTKLAVQPDIAKSWDISQDGKTYTFKLRDNVVFHNNRRVTANDIKYSLERAADPANASPTVKAYLGGIAGLKEKFDGKAKDISGVKVVDDTTIQITLTEPEDYFLAELAYPVAYVVDKEQIEKDPRNWTRKPNGTGPFKLAEFAPAERIRLIRNDRYHLGAPKLEEISFELAGGSNSTRYDNNEIHVGIVPTQTLEDVKAGKDARSKEYRAVNEMATYYLTLNSQKAPFDDIKVRQAFALSVDRENIIKVLLYGRLRLADGFLPPEMPGYSEAVKSFPYDPDKAKATLKESRYATSMPRVVLTYSGTGGNAPEILVAFQKGWKDILGVDVQLEAVESSTLLREQRRGTFQMLSDGWSADYPDPENFLGKLFASDSALNFTKYKNVDVDGFLNQARRETDRTKRFALYNQAEQKLLDDAAVIPTFWGVNHEFVKPCVKNLPAVSMTVEKYRNVEIDPNAK